MWAANCSHSGEEIAVNKSQFFASSSNAFLHFKSLD